VSAKRERDAQTAFEAGGQLGLAEKSDIARRATQMFDNLIGHNEVIRQKFEYKLEREMILCKQGRNSQDQTRV
jgi:hypothetical protein